MRTSPTNRTPALIAAAALGAIASSSVATGPLRPVALTGTSGPLGPGLGSGITFSTMQLVKTVHPEFGTTIAAGPSISGNGGVVFGAQLAGPGITTANGTGIWARRAASGLTMIARRGNQVPSLATGYIFGELFTPPQICDVGSVVFQSVIEGNDSSPGMNEALFTERAGILRPLVYEGVTTVPGTSPPIVFGGMDPNGDPWGNNQWVLNRHGDTALRCFTRDPNSAFGVFDDVGGQLSVYYRQGEFWTDGTRSCILTGASNPRLNDSGAILTDQLTDGLGGLEPWTNRALGANGFGIPGVGTLQPVFVSDQTMAPGTSSLFATCWSLRDFHINAAGRIAFAADIDGGGPGAQGGLWSDGRFGALQLVALSNTAAPGTPTGVSFNSNAQFILGSALADNNVVVFQGRLLQVNGVGGGNDTGLWTTRNASTGLPGNTRLLVREGSPVPSGFGPDYDGLNFGEVSRFWVNASGRVAFVTLHNDFTQAIWIEQADGSLVPIVKEFTTLDVSGNGTDVRLISTIDPIVFTSATGEGLPTAFNDQGDIAVRIIFADQSEGIFTTAASVACQTPAGTVSPTNPQLHVTEAVPLTATATGDAPLRYQWRHDGVPIPNATDSTFVLIAFSPASAGAYDCVLTNFCGVTTTNAAILTVLPSCPADYDGNGSITPSDVAAFVNAWFTSLQQGTLTGDFNHDGVVTPSDVAAFVNAWFAALAAGC